ncbi:MAG: hypothetical protein AB7F28_00210 [Candidatus Margulisiibacteriota bacterium]
MLKAKVHRRSNDFHAEALAEVRKTELHRMNIDIPVETFKKLKAKIILEGRYKSVSHAVKMWVDAYLKDGK